MKNILLFLLIFFTNFLNGQIIFGTIKDSLTGKPLELTTIAFTKSNFSVFSDRDGKYKINIIDANDSIRISNIGYDTKVLPLLKYVKKSSHNLDFNLTPKSEKLDAIIITKKAATFSKTHKLKSEKYNSQYLGFQFGTENCRLIENKNKTKGRIVSVILDLKKVNSNFRQCRLCEVDYLGTYNIKFYQYDTINKKPGEEIFNKNIIIQPQNKTYKLKIDVDSLKIKFPKEGICIGVEIINTKYTNPKKTFATIAPSIKFYESPYSKNAISWVRYRYENWQFKPMVTRDKRGINRINSIILIDVEAKYEK